MNKCSICNSNADLHSKLVSSSCNHFICGGCLYKEVIYNHEKLINSSDQEELMELKCIICDKGNFSLNNLELHQILNQRMKYVYIEKKGKSKCEGGCKDESNKKNIVVFCKNCQIFLCVTCFLTHSKDHNFSNNLDQNPNNYCSIHKEENLKIECLTCNIPLCWICRDKSHEGHVTNNITDSHFEKMEKFQSKFTFNDYEKICKTLEYKRDEVIDKLKLESEAQIGKFEKLITEIHDIIFVIQNQINKIRENLEVSVNNLKISFIKYYHDLENTKPDDYLNVFLNGKLLLKKFEINLKEPLHESFNNSYNNIYSKFKRLDEFKNNSNSKNKKSKIVEDDEECEINNSLSQIDDDTDQINNILNKPVKDLPLLKKSKNSRLFKPHLRFINRERIVLKFYFIDLKLIY